MENNRLHFYKQTIDVLLKKGETESQIEYFLYTFEVGAKGVPVHIHSTMDEFFFIHQGQMKFEIEGQEIIANQGDFISVKRGTRHGFFHHGLEKSQMFVQSHGDVEFAQYLMKLSKILNSNESLELLDKKIKNLLSDYDIS